MSAYKSVELLRTKTEASLLTVPLIMRFFQRLVPVLTLLAAICPTLVKADVLSLSSLQWSLKNQNGSIVVPAKVPSQAHLDLLDAGIITEPLLGINGASYL